MKRISVLLLLVVLAVGSVWRYSLPLDHENLILYYFFEENADGQSENENNGQPKEVPNYQNEVFGKSIEISGNQVVEITVSDYLNFNVD